MKSYDVVVIGGGPSGIVTAVTTRKQHPEKKVLMITEFAKGVVPCGIPYVFHKLGDIAKNVMGPKPFVDAGGEVLTARAEKIDTDKRTVSVSTGETIGFDRLVLATGSSPQVPTFIPGHDFTEGIGYVPKSYDGILSLQEKVQQAGKIVILGSGFTAVELAEQIAREPGKEVHLVYRAEHCLRRSFGAELAGLVDESISQSGAILHPSSQIAEILGSDSRATGIRLADGQTIDADLVIVAMGYKPSSRLAVEAGLEVSEHGAVVVDNYLRTSAEGVFAVGDCARCVGFITGRNTQVMLASTAAAEARILGHNLYSMRIRRNFPGTLSVFSTELSGRTFAAAGVTVDEAREAGIGFVVGQFQDVDRHPGTLPDVSSVGGRIIVSPGDGQILGGELFGAKPVGEMINTLALAIQKNVTVYELISFQLGTHPLLTTAPTKPILVKAAESAIGKIRQGQLAGQPVGAAGN